VQARVVDSSSKTAKNSFGIISTAYASVEAATATGKPFEFNLRFAGQYEDVESGYHYNWHRYYDPSTGRYLTPDPIGLAGGLNGYGYAGQDPIRSIDPWGLYTVIVVGSGTGLLNNPFGHAAIGFTGQGVYSYGTNTPLGGSLTDYLTSQAAYRDSTVYILDTTPEQEAKMLAEILKYKDTPLPNPLKDPLGALKDTCATRTQKTLEVGGITSILVPITSPFPSDLRLIANGNDARVTEVPKGSSIPDELKTFNK